jgi:predicted PurR-regulated permease PerM
MELSQSNIRKILFIIIISIVVFLGLQNIGVVLKAVKTVAGFLTPFFLGGSMAFILNVPLQLIERKVLHYDNEIIRKVRRPASIILSILLVAALLFLIVVLIVPQLSETIEVLTGIIPIFFRSIPGWIDGFTERFPDLDQWIKSYEVDWYGIGNQLMNIIKSGTSGILEYTVSLITNIFNFTFNFIVAFVFAINILANKERLAKQGKKLLYAYLQEPKADRVVYISGLSHKVFFQFVTGQLTEAVILGLLCFVGMLVFRFPFAPMAAVLIGFTALIPLFGAFIGTGLAAFMILMVDPMKAVWFVVFIIVLQQFEGNVIYPRVMGNSIGLPAMWVILAVTLGGSTMGIVGMLLFVPIFSIMYTLLKDAVGKRLAVKRVSRKKLT